MAGHFKTQKTEAVRKGKELRKETTERENASKPDVDENRVVHQKSAFLLFITTIIKLMLLFTDKSLSEDLID
ncbi:hypothetical protein C0Q70_04168 [Pomacea canaliculata]|uniref:Uncharacterized protein n=1 Tax=Pomacea canaliculata TaxID=400727 RepID=A0A2T7PUS3_POMCA|nr:hypothetical protein C0Q70_04168 [Pomacea canaliculata]